MAIQRDKAGISDGIQAVVVGPGGKIKKFHWNRWVRDPLKRVRIMGRRWIRRIWEGMYGKGGFS